MGFMTKAFNAITSSLKYGASQWARTGKTMYRAGTTGAGLAGWRGALGGAWEGAKYGARGMTKGGFAGGFGSAAMMGGGAALASWGLGVEDPYPYGQPRGGLR